MTDIYTTMNQDKVVTDSIDTKEEDEAKEDAVKLRMIIVRSRGES